VFKNETKLLAQHESWERVELGEVCEVLNGFAFKSALFNKSDGVPVVRIRDLIRGRTETFYNGDYAREYVVENGDLLVGMDGNFGCYEWNGGEALLNQRVCKLIPSKHYLDRKFLLFGINGYLKAIQEATSSVTVGHLSSKDIQRIPFPLPSLDEQRRIVAKLEKLLSRVDSSQARLGTILRILKRFRRAVLAAAISGRLTGDWRIETIAENSLPPMRQEGDDPRYPNGWRAYEFGDLVTLVDGDRGPNYPKQGDYQLKGHCLFLSTKNVREFGFLFDDVVFISEEKHMILRSGTLQRGDIVITTRGTLGNVAVYDEKVPYEVVRINSGMLILRKKKIPILNEFLKLYIASPYFARQLDEKRSGSAQPQLPARVLKTFLISLPPLTEQQEIVRRVKALFKTADALEARYRTAKAHVDKLAQSILAKAFRGELVPQDPSDEPASVLLARIKAGATEIQSGSKRTARA